MVDDPVGGRVAVDRCRCRRVASDAMPTNSTDSELLKPRDAARMLGCSTRALANWADAGKLNPVKLPGGSRRYHRAEIEALVPRG